MRTNQPETTSSSQSRRGFLARLGVGAAAVAAASLPFGPFRAVTAKLTEGERFPGKDSIFHPAQDPRLDPRRNKTG